MKLAITPKHYADYVARVNQDSTRSQRSDSPSADDLLRLLNITVASNNTNTSSQYHYLSSSQIQLIATFISKGQSLNQYTISENDLYFKHTFYHAKNLEQIQAPSTYPPSLINDLKDLEALNLVTRKQNGHLTLNLQKPTCQSASSSSHQVASRLLYNADTSSSSSNSDNGGAAGGDTEDSDYEEQKAENNPNKSKKRKSTAKASNSTSQRQLSNRESAARHRLRKKEYLKSLEAQAERFEKESTENKAKIAALTQENQSLREQLQQFKKQYASQHPPAFFSLAPNNAAAAAAAATAAAATPSFLTLPNADNMLSDSELYAILGSPQR
ncbi:MAG: bZIP transcription factor [Gammaproteobacteria bacterium]|nr:bZIP transcription factor [Gammaproteobacteria bacterium]